MFSEISISARIEVPGRGRGSNNAQQKAAVPAAPVEINTSDANAGWKQFSHGWQNESQSAFLWFPKRVVLATDIPVGS